MLNSSNLFAQDNKRDSDNRLHVVDRPFWAPNRIGTYITNEGSLVTHRVTGSAGMEWPVGSGNPINFATGFWIAGIKDGEIVTAAAEFVSEFQPGPVLNYTPGSAGTPANPESPFSKSIFLKTRPAISMQQIIRTGPRRVNWRWNNDVCNPFPARLLPGLFSTISPRSFTIILCLEHR